ncbi:unnamed protein product, partial [Staurois parvus]
YWSRPLGSVQQILQTSRGPTCSLVQRCPHRLLSCRQHLYLWSSILCLQSGHLLYYVRSGQSPVLSAVSSPVLCPQSLVISCTVSAVSGHLLYCVRSLWSSPVLCPQSLVIPCTVSPCSLWSSPVLCLQSLVISYTVSAVSGYLLYYVRSLWSSPVLCLQSLVISCTMSAVSGHLLYYVCSLVIS